MRNRIKAIIQNFIAEIVKESLDFQFTDYVLKENGETLTTISLPFKPNVEDEIIRDLTEKKSGYFVYKVKKVQYSHTGFTGVLEVETIEHKKYSDFYI